MAAAVFREAVLRRGVRDHKFHLDLPARCHLYGYCLADNLASKSRRLMRRCLPIR
jgi:hypothetical protein